MMAGDADAAGLDGTVQGRPMPRLATTPRSGAAPRRCSGRLEPGRRAPLFEAGSFDEDTGDERATVCWTRVFSTAQTLVRESPILCGTMWHLAPVRMLDAIRRAAH